MNPATYLRLLKAAACKIWGIHPGDLDGRTRNEAVLRARTAIAVLAYREGYTVNHVAECFGRDSIPDTLTNRGAAKGHEQYLTLEIYRDRFSRLQAVSREIIEKGG